MATNDTSEPIRFGDKLCRSTVEMEPTERHTLRLARISDYEHHAVNRTQPFVGLLAAIQADLFRTAAALERAVHRALGPPPATTDCLGAAEHETANFLRVVRQIADNSHLEITTRMAAAHYP
jgi:hypothetical protein